jgi:hypothetical protein
MGMAELSLPTVGYAARSSPRWRNFAPRDVVTPALVTCDVDNVASRRVIEHSGGVLEDERAGKLRFWVPTR